MAELDSVPGFERPMGAGTRDVLLSEDELGNKTYRNPTTGVTYTIRPNRDQRTALRKAKDWWNAGAELPTAGQVVEAVAGLPAAVYDTAQRTLRNEATLGEAMSFAPAMGAASLPFEAPEGAVRIFGGTTAVNAPIDRVSVVREGLADLLREVNQTGGRAMLDESDLSIVDPREMWEETGWMLGPDSRLRFEIPDDSVKVITKTEIDQLAEEVGVTPDEIIQMTRDSNFLALSDIMDHPSLFEAYPELANLPVRFDPELSSGEGIFDFSRIHLSPEDLNNPDVLKSVALHEAQHWVQTREGFYGGSNPEDIRDSAVGRQLSEEYWKRKNQIDADKSLSPEERASRTEEALREFNDGLFDAYQRVYGEDEARAVESRLNLTPLERSEMFPEDSGILSRSYGRNISRRTLNPYSGEEIPRRRYAEGGAVPMEDQMKFAFMADGGMIDDGKSVEPTTGNKVPPGSLANEVKDHVNAKLSPGEYVLPADVVQYYGLDKIEKLVGKAKEGLADLESRGRIGGKQDQEEDDLPFSDEELKSSEDDEDELEFAEGGMVPQAGGMHNRIYVDSQGTEHSVLFMGNMPLGYIDPKWRLKTQQVQEETQAPETSVQAVDDGGSGDNNAEGPKSPSEWTLEDFQKFDPSGNPLGPIGNILGGLGAGGGLISWGINAMREGTVNRAYSELEKRLQDPSLPEEEKASYTEQLARYKTAMENPQTPRTEQSRGLLGNLFGGDGLLGGLFNIDRRPQDRATQTPTTQTRAPVAAPAGLGGGDDNNYAPASSPRPQSRPAAQASPGAKGVGSETQKVTTTTGSGRNKRTETKNQVTNPGGFDKESGSWSVGPMAEGGLVARPKRRNKPKK